MIRPWRWVWLALLACGLSAVDVYGQIDPIKRDLIQVGYNAALQGHAPLSAYAFYYRNEPDFLNTNLTLRLAIAPTYMDSELGISRALGENTDLGIGLAGGGFADDYYEIQQGQYLPSQSFDGYGAQASLSVYHLFDPGRMIPLYGVVRGTAHFATYDPGSDTASNFQLPESMGIFSVRTGLRWGGREPTLFPALAMELSIWYQADFRTRADTYGFGDRSVGWSSQLFWAEAFLAYTFEKRHDSFSANLTAGTSIDADRFSAYRLGGFLPMVAEFPLSLPGYYYQELSAQKFLLFNGTYTLPLDRAARWHVTALAATSVVDYLPGLEQPGNWNSGVGAGVFYTSRAWRVMLGYGYGINAIRSDGRGAHTVGLLFQLDLAPAREAFFQPQPPGPWRGFQRLFGVFGS